MNGQYKYFRSNKPMVGVAIIGFALATSFCKLDGATVQGCSLFNRAAWVAFEVLRPVILSAWQSVPACLCEGSRFLQYVLQIGASIWPLLRVIAG
jgi:apolipoprotein N-acyltransferase